MASVFISYRRADTSGYAGRLAEALADRFGRENVFMDVDSIAAGADFEDRIHTALGASQVALVLIGDEWLLAEPDGRRRIDDQDDYVRTEIAAALKRNDVTVVPVLVEGVRMPDAAELPSDIAPLTKRNAFELSNKRWRSDLER